MELDKVDMTVKHTSEIVDLENQLLELELEESFYEVMSKISHRAEWIIFPDKYENCGDYIP